MQVNNMEVIFTNNQEILSIIIHHKKQKVGLNTACPVHEDLLIFSIIIL